MAPHGIWPTKGHDNLIAIAVRDDQEWKILSEIIGETWSCEDRWTRLETRLHDEDELERLLTTWTVNQNRQELAQELIDAGVPAAPVLKPQERIEFDQRTSELWVTVEHTEAGQSKVEGLPVRMSETPWSITRGAACLGEHNQYVFGEILGLGNAEIETLTEEGVI